MSKQKPISSNVLIGKEIDSDHTGSDCNNDMTENAGAKKKRKSKFDKQEREKNPDTTGIDTKSDKTRK